MSGAKVLVVAKALMSTEKSSSSNVHCVCTFVIQHRDNLNVRSMTDLFFQVLLIEPSYVPAKS